MDASAFSTEIARVLKTQLPCDIPTHSFHAFGRQILTAFREGTKFRGLGATWSSEV